MIAHSVMKSCDKDDSRWLGPGKGQSPTAGSRGSVVSQLQVCVLWEALPGSPA